MINLGQRQLIARERDDLRLCDNANHALQGRGFYGLGHMGSLEYSEKSLMVFRRGVDKVLNGYISFNPPKLGSNVYFMVRLSSSRRGGSGSWLYWARCRGLASCWGCCRLACWWRCNGCWTAGPYHRCCGLVYPPRSRDFCTHFRGVVIRYAMGVPG